MTTGTEEEKPRSRAEIEHAINALTQAELNKLDAMAERYAWCLGRSARSKEDLLQEAMVRTLSGARTWRPGVDFLRHMDKAMSSIAYSWHKANVEAPHLQSEIVSVSSSGEEVDHYSEAPSRNDLQKFVVDKEKFRSLIGQLKDDLSSGGESICIEILEHFYAGFEPKDIIESMSLSRGAYESQVKKLRRRANKIYRGYEHV